MSSRIHISFDNINTVVRYSPVWTPPKRYYRSSSGTDVTSIPMHSQTL